MESERNKAIKILIDNWDNMKDCVNVNVDDLINGKRLDILDAVRTLGLSIAANGSLYKTDKRGILPDVMAELYAERSVIKKQQLTAEQEVENIKIVLHERGE